MTVPKILQGTLDLLVLSAVSGGPSHGYGIGQWITRMSGDGLLVEEGALYHSLHRLARKGLLEAEWRPSDTGRRAKIYSVTEDGRAHLAKEEAQWARYSAVVSRLVEAGKAEGGA